MNIKEQLRAALDLLGPNGENWTKDIYFGTKPGPYCASGAIFAIGDYDTVNGAWRYLGDLCQKETGRLTCTFNDLPTTTFADIKALFERAIAACED